MKEYDQFMQQVKGKQKAPKDGFNSALGYNPSISPDSTPKQMPFDLNAADDRYQSLMRKIGEVKDPAMQSRLMQQYATPMLKGMQSAARSAYSVDRKKTPAEYEARMERMIAAYVQSGLSPQTARKLAMERMQA